MVLSGIWEKIRWKTIWDGEISEDVSIYSVYYSDTLESYEGILCEIGGIEVEALISGKTEIVNP